MIVCVVAAGCGGRHGGSDWRGRSGRTGRRTVASHSARPQWGGRGGASNGRPTVKCSMTLHSTRVEGAATRRRQRLGHSEWPPARCRRRCDCSRPPPPQGADTKDDRCRPAATAAVLRGAPLSSLSSGAEWVECSHRCWPFAPSAPTGCSQRSPPPTVWRPNPRRRAPPLAGERGMGAAMEPCEGGRVGTTKRTAVASATEPRNPTLQLHWARRNRVRAMCIRS
jgi:hypothetical protein